MASETGSPTLSDVADAVRELAQLMHANRLAKIDLRVGEVSISLRAGSQMSRREASVAASAFEPSAMADTSADLDGHYVTAPMIGTFYTSAAPGEPPFVRLGEYVEVGQTIGIIEAMKIMNEIPADGAGVVAEIFATNAQAVEYGSPLLRLVASGADA
jgi:acetyl-CoA carboxylase biotin carboxyl carrier protein